MNHEYYMQRCLDLAQNGLGRVAPNPLVGAVLVQEGKIIGEGFHQQFGHPHAEVNAFMDAEKKLGGDPIPPQTTMYVSLEPCNHQGKTPPCTDLIIRKGIKKVLIGAQDPNDKVQGKGIEKLRLAGIEVTIGILEKECRNLNKSFYTFFERNRPFIILKWAQSLDGFIAKKAVDNSAQSIWISNEHSRKLTHKWRSEIQAIMVGTNTALHDNPILTVRDWKGKNHLRITLDKDLRLPQYLHLFDQTTPTLIFTQKKSPSFNNLEYIKVDFSKNLLEEILKVLHQRNIHSLILEGGTTLLNSFIEANLWDEARLFFSTKPLGDGIKAPMITTEMISKVTLENDTLIICKNNNLK